MDTIQKTTDYSIFNISKNYPPSEEAIQDAITLLQKQPKHLEEKPIEINDANTIYKGGAEFVAAKRLGLPIYYVRGKYKGKYDGFREIFEDEMRETNQRLENLEKKITALFDRTVKNADWVSEKQKESQQMERHVTQVKHMLGATKALIHTQPATPEPIPQDGPPLALMVPKPTVEKPPHFKELNAAVLYYANKDIPQFRDLLRFAGVAKLSVSSCLLIADISKSDRERLKFGVLPSYNMTQGLNFVLPYINAAHDTITRLTTRWTNKDVPLHSNNLIQALAVCFRKGGTKFSSLNHWAVERLLEHQNEFPRGSSGHFCQKKFEEILL